MWGNSLMFAWVILATLVESDVFLFQGIVHSWKKNILLSPVLSLYWRKFYGIIKFLQKNTVKITSHIIYAITTAGNFGEIWWIGEFLSIAKFKIRQCICMTDSPNLMLTKVSRYTVPKFSPTRMGGNCFLWWKFLVVATLFHIPV